MQYEAIAIKEWRQFRDVEIELHSNLTILTGPNGSGKSTILSLLSLSMNLSQQEPFLATPVSDKKSGKSGYSIATFFERFNPFKMFRPSVTEGYELNDDPGFDIGSIRYDSGQVAMLRTDGGDLLQYNVEVRNRQTVVGFKIDSHRASPRYQRVKTLPVSGMKPDDAFRYFSESLAHYQKGTIYHREGGRVENPIAPLKETLIGFAAFGADNAHMKAVPELVGLYDGFQQLLRQVLPVEIGFERLEVRSPEIVVVSKTGEFPIDSASGGLMALIQAAWQVFLFTKAYGEVAVVLMDEPENHLHPSLQRDFLGNLVRAFPKVQFVVATHSPFVITSVKDSRIYALSYSHLPSKGTMGGFAVSAQEVEFDSKARTADKVLDEVLGVSVTIPIWAERSLSEIASRFEKSKLTEESIDQLRSDLKAAGLSEFLPEALGMMAHD